MAKMASLTRSSGSSSAASGRTRRVSSSEQGSAHGRARWCCIENHTSPGDLSRGPMGTTMTVHERGGTQAKAVASRESSSLLTINGGSSSIRFALYDESQPLRRLLDGKVDRVGLSGTNLTFKDSTGPSQDSRIIASADHLSAVAFLLDWLETQQVFASVKAVGHRVVHGMTHSEPERITSELLDELHRITPYDLEHLPLEI